MSNNKEDTNMKDEIRISKSTELHQKEVRVKIMEVPPGKMVEVRDYRNQNWALICVDKDLVTGIKELCKAKGLDIRQVMYGTLKTLKDDLKRLP